MRQTAAWLLILALIAGGCSAQDRVIVAAGTTLVDSGFLARVLEDYPGEAQISVVGASSLEALALGSGGSAELLITHLPDAENAFLAEHPGAMQQPVFASHFVLVGPESAQPGTSDPVEAFRMIAEQGHAFVSRADGSGTAAKERELWRVAGVDPAGEPWYTEIGQGMGFTLQVADQRNAFTLAEIGSFVGAESITLVPFAGGPDEELLENPYQITLVDEAGDAARGLFHWLTSEKGSRAVIDANMELFGEVLYAPPTPES